MGGFGSGKKYCGIDRRGRRKRTKRFIGFLPALNVVDLLKQSRDKPGTIFTWTKLKLTVENDVIRVETADGSGLVSKIIQAVEIPCNYGGHRFFGVCPSCFRHVRDLFFDHCSAPHSFACRKCFNMAYISQNTTLSYRLYCRHKEVGKKINDDPWNKPKWMRKKTFEKIRTQYFDLESMQGLADFLSLRSVYSAKILREMYGDIFGVPMEVAMNFYGKNWKHDSVYDFDGL